MARLALWARARATPRTGLEYALKLRRFLRFRAEHPDLPFIEQVQRWLGTVSASQHKVCRAALQRAFGLRAIDWEEITLRPYRRNEAALFESLLGPEARRQLRTQLTSARDRALLECFWTLRRAEVAALRWPDIDFSRGVVYVRLGKGGKPAVTLLPKETVEALAAWFQRVGRPAASVPVFPNKAGLPKTPYALGEEAKAILKRVGLWRPGSGIAHRFRRSFATEYLRANPQDLEGLRRLLRHESIGTTTRYVFLTTEDLSQRLERVVL